MRSISLAALAALAFASMSARAQERPTIWKGGEPRAFLATSTEVGPIFLRDAAQVGYGRPHYQWLGVEGQTYWALNVINGYMGLRAVSPLFQARVGLRYTTALLDHFLVQAPTYDHDATEQRVGGRAHYLTYEGEFLVSTPVPLGSVFALGNAYLMTGVPDGFDVVDELVHVVVRPPALVRGRVGFFAHLGSDRALRLGLAGEVIDVPKREAMIVVRAGPIMIVRLTPHLEAFGSFLPVLASRDSLGLLGAELNQVGLRYRWATGDRLHDFP